MVGVATPPLGIVVVAILLLAQGAATSAAASRPASCASGDAPGAGRSQAMLQHASGAGAILMEELAPRRRPASPPASLQVGSSLPALPQKLSWWIQKGHASKQVELLMKSMTSAGQEPTQQGIAGYIRNNLLPQAEQTKDEMQNSVDNAAHAIAECSVVRQGAESQVREQETQLMIGESRHSECMVMEGQKKKTVSEKCEDLSQFSASLSAPQATLSGVNTSSTDDVIEQLRGMSEYYNDLYPTFMEKKKACDESEDEEGNQEMECDTDKNGIEGAYCNLKSQRSRVCQEYAECFGKKVLHYDKVAANVKDLETHMKGNYKALACFRISDSEEEKEDPDCDPDSVDVSHLSITYPEKPEKEACVTMVKTNWNYTGVECPQAGEVPVSEDASPTAAPAPEAAGNATAGKEVAPANATEGEEVAPTAAATGDNATTATEKLLQASGRHKAQRQSGSGHGRRKKPEQ